MTYYEPVDDFRIRASNHVRMDVLSESVLKLRDGGKASPSYNVSGSE